VEAAGVGCWAIAIEVAANVARNKTAILRIVD